MASAGRRCARPRRYGELLAQGEGLEGELPVAAAEEQKSRSRWSSVLIMRQQLSPDQSREINHLASGC